MEDKRITITLLPDHYLYGNKKEKYDINLTSRPYKVAEADAYGMFCLISFLGKWKVVEDKDFATAITREVQIRLGDKATDEQQQKEYAHLGKETNWFHTFSNGDWDAADKLYKEDAAIRSRFNPFATYWWKITCDVIFTKIQNKTYEKWIAEIREAVGEFLDDGVETDKINEQEYNVSYKNYKTSYELVGRITDYLKRMIVRWEEIAVAAASVASGGGVEVGMDKIFGENNKDWGINSFSCFKNATRIIYDQNNMFHLFIHAQLNTIITDKLRERCWNDLDDEVILLTPRRM